MGDVLKCLVWLAIACYGLYLTAIGSSHNSGGLIIVLLAMIATEIIIKEG